MDAPVETSRSEPARESPEPLLAFPTEASAQADASESSAAPGTPAGLEELTRRLRRVPRRHSPVLRLASAAVLGLLVPAGAWWWLAPGDVPASLPAPPPPAVLVTAGRATAIGPAQGALEAAWEMAWASRPEAPGAGAKGTRRPRSAGTANTVVRVPVLARPRARRVERVAGTAAPGDTARGVARPTAASLPASDKTERAPTSPSPASLSPTAASASEMSPELGTTRREPASASAAHRANRVGDHVSSPPRPPAAPDPAAPVYSPGDPGVRPPVSLRPRYWLDAPDHVPSDGLARVEILVSAEGEVESARMVGGEPSYFDGMILSAVKGWRFQPATRDGRPVRYRQRVWVATR